MRGSEMVFLVNGFIFLGFAVLAGLYANLMQHSGRECQGGNLTLCDRSLSLSDTSRSLVPWSFAIGVLLLGVAGTMFLLRPPRPPEAKGATREA